MKILAIRGRNLASLEGEFEIDFMQEPLRSAGLFAITGQTGAGKSTLLDALCLALFDDAPRLNKAETAVNISDVTDKTITQKDSRTLLRRGASEGYAEVDFIALNGDKYRSCWMVRRARGKADRALQATTMKLENLSTGTEEQGTKKNLLDRIVELIGLSFDQFTRAVLLAQGDFANFLKAKQNEKAELLEKLTGTEIYSQISVRIYQKHEEAKKAQELIQQRMKDVRLLGEEELQTLIQESEALKKESEPLKKLSIGLGKNLEWIRQERQLMEEVAKARESLQASGDAIVQAARRYEYLSFLDLSMEIREVYFDRQEKLARQQKVFSSLKENEKQLQMLTGRSTQIEASLKNVEGSLFAIRQAYESIKPELEKARELDFRLSNLREKLTEVQKEKGVAQKQLLAIERAQEGFMTQEVSLKKKEAELAAWFARYEHYREVVPRIDLINNHIAVARSAKLQEINTEESLKSSKGLLDADQLRLKELEEEFARLHELFPAEVLHLRSKLAPDTPCPVCGSLHHPFSTDLSQSVLVNERELEASKKKNRDEATALKERIERTRESIAEFDAYIRNYRKQYENTWNELSRLLQNIPGWEAGFEEERLHHQLNEFVSQWNTNKVLSDNCRQEILQLVAKLESGSNTLSAFKTVFEEKEKTEKEIEKIWIVCLDERKHLLNGRSVAEVEQEYATQIDKQNKSVEEAREGKEKLEQLRSELTGTISQLKADGENIKEEVARLNCKLQEWLNDEKHPITDELLVELMSKSRDWIDRERTFLSDLKNKELVARTTLEERQKKLTTHRLAPDKPEEERTEESIILQQSELDVRAEVIGRRQAEIQVALLTHEKGKELIKSFEKEKLEKESLYENWAKLNELLGSASGNRFKTIAQGYTLDVLLGYANKHLEDLTKRYRLEKIPDTLALQVVDNDMLGEVRSVHSLSGGESFLISLALALGLSSLSSSRMKIESLFIDEGFGALDIDTLSVAMDALDKLQTQGRKIGVISHVEEMKERIATQIQVLKSANGKSYIQVVG